MNAEDKRELSLEQLNNALNRLGEVLKKPLEDDDIVLDATIQRFEFSVELFWKTMRRFLAAEGIEAKTPKEVLQKAYAANWIENETLWLSMLKDRNLTSHTYEQENALEIYQSIESYFQAMSKASQLLQEKL